MPFLNPDQIQEFYLDYIKKLQVVKEKLHRPLTYAEKILFTHFAKAEFTVQRSKSSIPLQVDRVAMQDATAQMALLQFILTERDILIIKIKII